ncbi:alkaline phosphatase [Phytoactinopolyspora halotolerans]|uniref:Alkaline phosphatase n=1 Tax=Phytoactinopolyspora halotolerans TaxID=1981512 RepID=A0A6L9SFT3_9ACTN|nr:alkaline phosphatase [Phytoactinopolyspora halotolerans]NEE03937.1 alkaline phosphatase [Phytoactinopolyspora halotolerans]
MNNDPRHTDGQGDTTTTSGISRRAFFAGGGGAAAAVIVGLGASPALATPTTATPARRASAHGLQEADPHASTGRSAASNARRPASPEIRILPIDRAKFRAGARFDLRVEAAGVDPQTARIDISVQGPNGPAPILTGDPVRTSSQEDSLEVTYPGVFYAEPGDYRVWVNVRSRGRTARQQVDHDVVGVPAEGQRAKNVIFFLGDGMGSPAITAARILSKGLTEGKYHGLLEMDQMQYRGLVGTSGVDSIATDSANSMSAYMCGHKSSVNAMGVYESNEPDPNKHPRVETIAEIVKRTRGMSVGVVTTSEVQDATPAAVFAHTRRRSEYAEIMDQALAAGQTPDVWMGGGQAWFLPQSQDGSRRDDDRDMIKEFEDAGYTHVANRADLEAAMSGGAPEKLLGLFHPGNLNVYLDRQHIKQPEVLGDWDDQPTLMETTEAALKVLEQNENGFFLAVEGASIDKMEHPMDGPRVAYDTIELDRAIGVARKWAEGRDDTLIVVTADHNHSMSIVGTHDRRNADGRQANGVYADAGFPTYVDDDGDGFPDDPNPDVQLFFGWSNHPDHSDDFQHNSVFAQPALIDPDTGVAVDNPERDPDADVQIGNLPYNQTNCVHTVEDVSVFASGPGAERFNAFLDNTEVFHAMIDALGLDPLNEKA